MSLCLRLLAILGTTLLSSTSFATTSANEAAILKMETAMVAADTADKAVADWDKHAHFDDLLASKSKTAEYDGIDAIRENFTPQFASISIDSIKMLRMKIVTDERFGFAYSTWHFTAKGKGDNPGMDFVYRQTSCYEKKGSRWWLVHQQVSVPFDPVTGKAVFDSK